MSHDLSRKLKMAADHFFMGSKQPPFTIDEREAIVYGRLFHYAAMEVSKYERLLAEEERKKKREQGEDI